MTTIHILLDVILFISLIILVLVINQIKAKSLEKIISEHKFQNPLEVLNRDFSRIIKNVKGRLGTDKKGGAFPIKISLVDTFVGRDHTPHYFSWTNDKDIPPIIGGLLEQEGWVVYKTP
jgi:hypothetical protein